MALIYCRYCGHRVSDRALKCPKCGGDLTVAEQKQQEQTVVKEEIQETSVQNESKNGTLWAVIACLVIAVAGVIGYYLYNQKQRAIAKQEAIAVQHRLDSITAVTAEQARLECIRRDSIRKVNFTSADLSLFDLHGDVQTMKIVYDEIYHEDDYPTDIDVFRFKENGVFVLNKSNEHIIRDSEARIVEWRKEGYSDDEDVTFSYTWDSNRVVKISSSFFEGGGEDYFEFDKYGILSKKISDSCGEGGCNKETTSFSGYVFDEVGNWIKRDYQRILVITCGSHESYMPNCEFDECRIVEKKGIIKRTITYYTQRDSKRYTLNEYLSLKKE